MFVCLGRAVRRSAVLALLALGLGIGASSPAHAGGDLCGPGVVHDPADVLDDRGIAEVARAEFPDTVTVKVIAWNRTPGSGDLYDALVAARAECGGWGFSGGGGRSLLVLGASAAGRELGSHHDGRAVDRSDAARDEGEVDRMGPAFGNGQWTDGMLAGLQGYAEAYADPVPTDEQDLFPTGT